MSAADPTAPRATHEFRMEDAVRLTGDAYLRYRDGGLFTVAALEAGAAVTYIGRDADCLVRIRNDERVSRRHARLIYGAGQWSIEDGPSRNGTFVDDRRTAGEQILADKAQITVGRTVLSFHASRATGAATLAEEPPVRLLAPTPTQRKVLAELARPYLEGGPDVPVAPTNAVIAQKLGYQVSTIRDAVSDLYRQAGLTRGSSDQRAELVRLAIREGAIAERDRPG